ncbi:serine/threonine protein kinase [Spirochaeta thermophila DSM 6578]|uniref:non-specific serine/threonine protein kinase n=1 Tax=Winmispira thermophila (strain ATCC 700085 / DSM 6578 / Z-1203) TaxID=869211 RepID=G0GA32_WINT7|nr:serine/threonine-protein kinase [Spirochaeta thermophila]AEJ61720.1 serine/threonine protein kinase [Spirochaeta thermophila DSM 6578]
MAEQPKAIGNYKVISLLARGGMGAVYKALHPVLKRHVVIKKLALKGRKEVIERFKREAKILLDCKDQRIVHMYDYFTEGRSHYIVMEFVDGMAVDVLIKHRRYLPAPLALYILREVCYALKYAHDRGIVHRDIKPANILISKEGEVKLTDFGIAAIESDEEEDLTREGMTLGTPSYMPPEQFKDAKHVDKRADIYALGVMLYEMVTGKRPFPGNFAPETIMMIQKGRYLPVKKLNPDVPRTVSRIIRRTINPNPRRRFQDVAQIIRMVERYLSRFDEAELRHTLSAMVLQPAIPEPEFRQRRRGGLVAALLTFGVLLLGGAGYAGWWTGFIQETVLTSRYGRLAVEVRVPVGVKEPEELFLKGVLFINDRNEIPPAPYPPLRFEFAREEGENLVFSSRPLYVAPGAYRLKLMVEHRVYWYSWEILPLSEGEHPPLLVDVGEVAERPLRVEGVARDALSDTRILEGVRFLVLLDGRWVPIDEVEAERLVTGRVWRFRAEAAGYYPEVFSLLIRPGQDELILSAALVPKPGRLVLSAPEGVRFLLDGKERVRAGGQDLGWVDLSAYRGGEGVWDLPSGRYEAMVRKGEEEARLVFLLPPEGEVRLSVREGESGLMLMKEE